MGIEQDPNWPKPEKVKHLIIDTGDYIVFIDDELDVDWSTSDAFDKRHPETYSQKEHDEVLNFAAKLECIPSDHHTESIRINFKRMIGEAIARNLVCDYEHAKEMLQDAEQYITERNLEKSRFWYLSACGSVALVISAVGIIAWILRSYVEPMLGGTVFFLLLSSSAGALGALFSVIMRLGKSAMNPAAGKSLHQLEGMYRVLAGCVSALLLALSVKLELLTPVFTKAGTTNVAMVLVGLVAGASERWAPSLIARIESGEVTQKKKPEGTQ